MSEMNRTKVEATVTVSVKSKRYGDYTTFCKAEDEFHCGIQTALQFVEGVLAKARDGVKEGQVIRRETVVIVQEAQDET